MGPDGIGGQVKGAEAIVKDDIRHKQPLVPFSQKPFANTYLQRKKNYCGVHHPNP